MKILLLAGFVSLGTAALCQNKLPVTLQVPSSSVKNVLNGSINYSTVYTASNTGVVPLKIYMAASATASPSAVGYTVAAGQSLTFTPLQLGGNPASDQNLNIYNYTDGSGTITISNAKFGSLIIMQAQFTYDPTGNRTKRVMGVAPPSTATIGNLPLRRAAVDSLKAQVLVYPNPTFDILKIQLPDADNQPLVHITLTNLNGQTLLEQQTTTGYHEISFGSLAAGNYILRLSYDDKILTYNIIKLN